MTLTKDAFERFADMLRRNSGLAIGPEKAAVLEARLGPILHRHQIADLNTLATRVGNIGNPALMRDVVEAMTTHESSFFRDGKPFVHFAAQLPALRRACAPGEKLRIWSAASSFGQEAYSIAMTLTENAAGDPGAEILGTDISRPVLARATDGKFSALEVQRGVSAERLSRHFDPVGADWRVKQSLRAMTKFREWNILHESTSLGLFDVIFCRNVLIYFDPILRKRVLGSLASRLKPGGLLYLGCTETILEPVKGLAAVAGESAIWYAKP